MGLTMLVARGIVDFGGHPWCASSAHGHFRAYYCPALERLPILPSLGKATYFCASLGEATYFAPALERLHTGLMRQFCAPQTTFRIREIMYSISSRCSCSAVRSKGSDFKISEICVDICSG